MGLRIGIVAGEASGDLLGAAILTALKTFFPDIEAVGVAGPCLLAAGAKTLFPMEKLSVMGFSEVVLRLPELLSLQLSVKRYFLKHPPDLYLGIDSPDFNLPIEIALKKARIKTVHCNSPTIWAWREKRIFKIKRAVDLMLTLFPFEAPYYEAQDIPVKYIGHPLADIIPLKPSMDLACEKPFLTQEKHTIALLPGSRNSEIKYIGPVLLKSALKYWHKYPHAQFMSPMANQARWAQFYEQWQSLAPKLPLQLVLGQSHEVMSAADLIVLASGTATLEAMLLKKPMVVVYRGSRFSYWMAKQLIRIRQFSLPNILSNQALVPELIQHQATPDAIFQAMESYPQNSAKITEIQKHFDALHKKLRCSASHKAAEAIFTLLKSD